MSSSLLIKFLSSLAVESLMFLAVKLGLGRIGSDV